MGKPQIDHELLDAASEAVELFEPDQPPEHLPFFPYRFMAIDVGSNAIKYRVWTIEENGSLRQLNERRFPVRLGHRTFTTGLMSEKTIKEYQKITNKGKSIVDLLYMPEMAEIDDDFEFPRMGDEFPKPVDWS